MNYQNSSQSRFSRRKFISTAAGAAAAFTILPGLTSCSGSATGSASGSRLNSKFGGVQIGCITYSFRDMDSNVETTIKACVDSGCSSVELMSTGIEEYLGAPQAPPRPRRTQITPPPPPPSAGGSTDEPQPGSRPAGGFQRQAISPEQQAAQDKYTADLKEWRLTVPMSKFEELRVKFNDAGIDIHIVKFSPGRWPEDEIDYAFRAAKALGAKGVTDEIGDEEVVRKMATIAGKHEMFAIFHQHMQFVQEGFI